MRVLILNNIPAPYFDPLFERLGEAHAWSLRVCYTSIWNENAGWAERPIQDKSFRTIVLDRQRPTLTRWLGSSAAAGLSLLAELWRERPEYLISYGYTLFPQFVAIMWSVATQTPFAVIGDANVHLDKSQGLRGMVKRNWLHWVVRRVAALIAIGTANRQFWEKYGARREQLFEARYAVDNDYFASAVEAERQRASALREEMGLSGRVVFLFVGRLVKLKNVDVMVRAIQSVPDCDASLVIVGDGEERRALTTLAIGDSRFIFAGAVSQSELPRYYALGDVLILLSKDAWGLVVNEAMAAGLAIIAHEHCGAAVDLVGSDNGISLSTFTADELAIAIRRLSEDRDLRIKMQVRSQSKIGRWSIEGAARGIIEAVSQSSQGKRAGRTASTVGERG